MPVLPPPSGTSRRSRGSRDRSAGPARHPSGRQLIHSSDRICSRASIAVLPDVSSIGQDACICAPYLQTSGIPCGVLLSSSCPFSAVCFLPRSSRCMPRASPEWAWRPSGCPTRSATARCPGMCSTPLPDGSTMPRPSGLMPSPPCEAPPVPGAKPLVVISHGHGGSNLGHHDLAEYLASHGFIVATIEHPKDNFHDTSGNGQPKSWLAAAPDQGNDQQACSPTRAGKPVDANRIGVAGFSAGGYTSLLLWARCRGSSLHRVLRPSSAGRGDLRTGETTWRGDREAFVGIAAEEVRSARAEGRSTSESGVRDGAAKHPFRQAGLEKIKRPVFLYYAEMISTAAPENALRIAP